MNEQLDFDDYLRARRSDPDTSKAAAKSVNVTALEARVLDCLTVHGPKTINEVADILSMSLVTASPRFRPLAAKGKIRDTGRRQIGENGRGRIIWEAVP